MVRPERRVVLTGESPVRVSAEAPGSRLQTGGEIRPSQAEVIMDGQSVKTTERGGTRGFDGYKRVKGRKRHILVDTLGLMIASQHVRSTRGCSFARRSASSISENQHREAEGGLVISCVRLAGSC
jgi:hypothetical protein